MRAVDPEEKKLDVALMEGVAKGDQDAFAKLYDRFSAPLFSMIRQVTQDQTEAEDALSEGFAQIWRKANTYDSERSAAFTWAVMLVRNKTIDRLRVRQRHARLSERLAGEMQPADDVDAESMLEPGLRERRKLVREAVGELPEDQRTALEMNFFNGLTHEEIAKQLEMPLGTVKARIRRGLQKLRSCWKETR